MQVAQTIFVSLAAEYRNYKIVIFHHNAIYESGHSSITNSKQFESLFRLRSYGSTSLLLANEEISDEG